MVFPAPCRASRLPSLQIPTGTITRQPMVRVTIQTMRMVTGPQNCGDRPDLVIALEGGGHEHGNRHAHSQERSKSGEVP